MTPNQLQKFKQKFMFNLIFGEDQKQRKIQEKFSHRPRCSNDGCEQPRMLSGNYKVDGSPSYKTLCSHCNTEKYHENINRGGYSKYRKNYCENVDGRLGGHICTTTIIFSGQLEVDHVDGNPFNNKVNNLQTLCACCHAYKTNVMEDGQSIGRKRGKNNA
jgi:hypothetical protein